MSDEELEARVRAVERALVDGDATVADISDAAAVHERLDDIDARLDALAERVDALDATVQSLHGYVGELEHVNDCVERRADAARAAVERLDGQRHPQQSDAAQAPGESPDATPGTRDAAARHRETTDAGSFDGTDDAVESLLDRVRDSL